jgi:hypothetical protein
LNVSALERRDSLRMTRGVPLGDHPAQYRMLEKHAKLAAGGPNPFIDEANCNLETDIMEAMFRATLAEHWSLGRT